jgi:hypothetical protein
MIDFLRQLWGFVRPYRGRFLPGLLCGVFYGLVGGGLPGHYNNNSHFSASVPQREKQILISE